MHPSSPSASKKRGTIQIVAELLIFLLLTAATAFLLRPLQADLSRKMTVLRDSFIATAEKSLGRRIEYASMGPSLFRAIDLRGVRVIGADGEALLTLNRLRIEYSLLDLLRGERVGALRGLSLDRPVLRLDMERDADLMKRLASFNASASISDASPSLVLPDTRVRVKGGSFLVSGQNFSASLDGVDFDISAREERFSISARAVVDYRDARLPAGFDVIKTAFSLSGDASADLRRADFSLSFSHLAAPAFSVLKQGVLISYSEGLWDLRKAKDRVPFDIRVRYDPRTGACGASIVMDDFVPAGTVEALGPWKAYIPLLSSRVWGRAEADFSSVDSFTYRFDLRARASSALSVPDSSLDLQGEGDQSIVRLRTASMKSPSGSIDFNGSVGLKPLRPEGTLRVSDLKLSDEAKISAFFRLATEKNAVSLFSESVSIGGLRLDAFDALVRFESDVVAFTASALRFEETGKPEETADVRLARVRLEGSYAVKNPYLQASLSLDSFSASDILVVARPFLKGKDLPDQVGTAAENISLTTEIFVTADAKDFSFNVPRLVAAWRGRADAYAVMSLSGTKGKVSFRDVSFFWKGGSAGGALSLDFADVDDIAFSAQASYRDTYYSIDGLLLDRRNLSFRGDYGLSGNLILAEGGSGTSVSGTISFDSLPVPVAEYRFFTSLSASFRYASADLWSADVLRFTIEETGGALKRPLRLGMQAKIDQGGASISGLSVEDSVGRLTGEAGFDWKNGLLKTAVSVRLADQLGEERYEAEGSLSDDGIRFRLYGAGIRGSRFLDSGSKLRATGEVRARWKNLGDYEADFKVADLRAELNAEEYRFSGAGRITQDSLELENVRVAYKDGVATASSVIIDRSASQARLNAGFRGSFAGREAETSLTASVAFAPFSDWTKVLSAADRGTASISVGRTRYGTLDLEPFGLNLTKEGASFSMDGGPQNALRLRFDADGSFFAALSAPVPIRGNVIGTIRGGMINATASGLYLDFASLWSVLNIPDVVFSGGIAAGSLTISGPLADPEFFGSASATGFRATVPAWIPDEIGPVSAAVAFEGKEFKFGPVPVSVQKGGGTISGRFRFDRWVPFEFALNINIPSATPIPAKADVSGFIARGLASGSILVSNSIEHLGISGMLEVESTIMTIDAVTLQSSYSKPFQPLDVVVNLDIATGKKVEFDWPSSDYPVLRGYADIGDALHIAYDGITGRYSLQGDVDLRGGEVFYFMRSFYIRSGSIKFNENQLRVDPRLSLQAEIRDRNNEGPVTISLLVDEARLSTFIPRFESTPPLSQAEIFGMLGQNLVGTDATGSSAQTRSAVLSATSDVLAQFNVVRIFERKARELLGFDMFSVRTQLIQNAFFNATGLISDPVDRKAGLGNYFDNTTVYMGKFFGSDIFVQGMLSLQRDETKSTDLLGGLTLAPEIGVEWKTPLFLLRWNFAPDWTNDRERLFINDHSFTLTWRKSF